jgi:hypothetical protein
VDKADQSSTLRVVALIWTLITLASLVVTIGLVGDPIAITSSALVFVGAVVLLGRTHRPMHTWPDWLVAWKG